MVTGYSKVTMTDDSLTCRCYHATHKRTLFHAKDIGIEIIYAGIVNYSFDCNAKFELYAYHTMNKKIWLALHSNNISRMI
jgi:hypothetical protein